MRTYSRSAGSAESCLTFTKTKGGTLHQRDEALAARSGIWIVRFRRLLRLSYLAPDIVRAIMDGRQPASLTVSKLNALTKLPLCWHAQKAMLGVG